MHDSLHFLVFVIIHFMLLISMIKFAEILNCSTFVGISVASYRSAQCFDSSHAQKHFMHLYRDASFVCLIRFLTSHKPFQLSFSYMGTGLPGLNQY